MMEQAALAKDYERLLSAAERVVEAWQSMPEGALPASGLDSACRNLASVVDSPSAGTARE
jgi:hypothetical protein